MAPKRAREVDTTDDIKPKRRRQSAIFDDEDDDVEDDSLLIDQMTENEDDEEDPRNLDDTSTGEFREGAVVRVKLKNWVTYTDVEFFPGPRLNVILAPNGSGKSSIVCALVLGLGGQPKSLGRAKEISEYINHQFTEGYAEIELYRKNGNMTIRRTIHKDNTSKWHINGKATSKEYVDSRLQKLHVQVENLCQFLPQDRVPDFAKLTPPELLESTEKAIGNHRIVEQHKRLIELGKQLTTQSSSSAERNKHLDDLRRANETLHRDVLRFQQRQNLLEEKKTLEKKLPWLIWRKHLETVEELKQQKADAERAVQEHERSAQPAQENLDRLKREDATLRVQKEKLTKTLAMFDTQRRSHCTQLDKLEESYDSTKSELESYGRRARERQRQLESAKQERTKLESDIESMEEQAQQLSEALGQRRREQDALLSEQATIQVQRSDYHRQCSAITQQLQQIGTSLAEIENVRRSRIESLRQHFQETYNAYQWVQENRGRFQGEVLGPLMLEINVPNEDHARIIESVVSRNAIESFVVTNREDQNTLYREVRMRQNLRINIISTPATDFQPTRVADIESLREFNIVGWLDECVQAPAPVLHAMENAGSISRVAVANHRITRDQVDRVFERGVTMVVSPTMVYRYSRSQYGSHRSSVTTYAVRNAVRYLRSVDTERKARLEGERDRLKLEEREAVHSIQELDEQIRNIQMRMAAANATTKEYEGLKTKIRGAKTQLARRKSRIEELEGEVDSEEEEKLQRKLRKYSVDRAATATAVATLMRRITDTAVQQDKATLTLAVTRDQIVVLERQQADFHEIGRRVRARLDGATAQYNEAVTRAKELKREAEAKVKLTPEIKAQFDTLPDTIEELQAKIDETQTRADMHYLANPKVLEEYEKRRVEIERLEAELADERTRIQSQQDEIQTLKAEWQPVVERLIERISKHMAAAMRTIGCKGSVHLSKHESDYSQWGIEIKVNFRNSETTSAVLDSHTQSGGERSVSTMMYLASLHMLTKCPFRLVDEINQNMDPNNERRVFEEIARVTSKPSSPQFFLISPKLLPALKFTQHMVVSTIMNGPYFVHHTEFATAQRRFLDDDEDEGV